MLAKRIPRQLGDYSSKDISAVVRAGEITGNLRRPGHLLLNSAPLTGAWVCSALKCVMTRKLQ
jgi:hypothetical protein